MSKSWPKTIAEDVNAFTFANLDPEANPTLKVSTWSNVFGEGGRVSVDAKVTATKEDGTTYETHATLASISLKSNGSVVREREHLQELLDLWNEDAENNWRNLITQSRAKVRKYYERTAQEAKTKLAKMQAGAW